MGIFSRKEYDYDSRFPLWKKGGSCDVCGKPIDRETAYQVPRNDFWSSKEYRKFAIDRRIAYFKSIQTLRSQYTDEQLTSSVIESFIKQAAANKSDSAVCKDCIHMFE